MATLKEAMRRVYHELVKRRSAVQIQPAAVQELAHPPIFLTGVYRSGTTLLRYIVESHSHICCPPETNFIQNLRPLVDDELCKAGFEPMGFDQDHVIQRLREFTVYFFQNYASAKGKPRWADKTPDYVDHLDLILRMFPEAKFIIIYRHGLDQAHSYTRGGTFPRVPLEPYVKEGEDLRIGATRYWAEKSQKMMDFVEAHPDICHALRYEDLCDKPEQIVRGIFEFLGEPWEDQVMAFYEQDHDKGNEDGRVGATRGFSVSKEHYKDWPAELRSACDPIAQPVLKALGYVD